MVVMPLALSACNTMEGAGEDIEAAGESVQDAAE
ncbi:entericidin A/B family lipoprotein [Planctomycetales bacterium ZRK34]|nr:entericidin A/B family lipoprotein [Planctomycetales bacterium ZRK34]